jgi:hypothetical protein
MHSKPLLLILISSFFLACETEDEPFQPLTGLVPVPFVELEQDSWPPCIDSHALFQEVVLADNQAYESFRRDEAPQGEYEEFLADGVVRNFHLSYVPLDATGDGLLGPGDFNVYVEEKPLYVSVAGQQFQVRTNPIYIIDDSALVFTGEFPNTITRKVHYLEVFSIDSRTGEVRFVPTPSEGSRILISGSRRLYEEYQGRPCTTADEFLSDQIVIGKLMEGNDCFLGFDKQLFLDHDNRMLIYLFWTNWDTASGCAGHSISRMFRSWISVAKPPAGYEIVFVEEK